MENTPALKAAKCFAIAFILVMLCSCLSFNIGDWPSPFVYPHNGPSENLCGSIGAFFSYYLLYYVGPGIFVILVSAICFLALSLTGRDINQPVLRSIGLCLLTIAASTTFYCFFPFKIYSFPTGSGGILGVGATQFLRGYFAVLGTAILITATWIVGLVLLADSFVLMLFGGLAFALRKALGLALPAWAAARQRSEVLGEIWQKLSARQWTDSAQDEELQEEDEDEYEQDEQDEQDDDQPRPPIQMQMISSKARKTGKSYAPQSYDDYQLPPLELLAEPEYTFAAVQGKVVKAKANSLERLLSEFNINAS
jgi:hypothetical protein